ncbi:hypothetical protein CYY_007517 [Polysphondylium violaceum]|uniref:Calcineurin-like phosphoesterase domain-containing protein n=1 Tax=Polysphondylium violaceum TaxID=133409 RepID=A0A8J4V254_9MYCE|nr:hypothetical protein CYY_007517 [Polysphondylium violaceum]
MIKNRKEKKTNNSNISNSNNMSLMKEEPWNPEIGEMTPEMKPAKPVVLNSPIYNAKKDYNKPLIHQTYESFPNNNNSSFSSTSGLNSNNYSNDNSSNNNKGYQFVQPTSTNIESEIEKSLTHPVKRGALIVMILVAILLPTGAYLIGANVRPHSLDLPSYVFLLPSIFIFAPIIAFFYKKKAERPQIRSTGVTMLMTGSFIYYSLFVNLFASTILVPYFKASGGRIWFVSFIIYYLHLCVFIQYTLLSKCKLRPKLYLYLVSYPASTFFTAIILSLPIYFFTPFVESPLAQLVIALFPVALAGIGLYQTTRTLEPNKWTVKELTLRSMDEEEDQLIMKRKVKRVACGPPKDHEITDFKQPISIIQIADPHLGPMMSVDRLRSICENTVKLNPDLVLLTGDFFTVESFNPIDAIDRALEPLKELSGKTFACLGNHDYEEGCVELLEKALERIGCCLLVDKCVMAETRIGKVQILGFDYRHKARQEHITQVCAAYPPIPNVPRIGLLHDPGAFKFIPVDYQLAVFSGHTHGGQIGLNCLGINASIVGITGMPDHSLWQNGNNYLYVHSGQGCRSMMGTMVLRVGVPTEDSLLQVYFEN